MNKIKNSQISFEFIIIFGIVFFVLIGFIYIINNRISNINEDKEYIEVKNLIDNIKNEIMLASSVNNNYYREFYLPVKLYGYDYLINLSNDEMQISLFEKGLNNRIRNNYFTILPLKIKGGFSEKINESTKKHCITKNNIDGIRISINQASLDSKQSNIYDEYDLEVNEGEEFDLYVNLYCVYNIRSVQFTIKFDPNLLELKGYSIINEYSNEYNLFDEVDLLTLSSSNVTLNGIEYSLNDDTIGRRTFAVIGENCATGSGSIIKLKFSSKNVDQETITKIKFDEDLGEYSLRILDCNFNAYTSKDLPDTRKEAVIRII